MRIARAAAALAAVAAAVLSAAPVATAATTAAVGRYTSPSVTKAGFATLRADLRSSKPANLTAPQLKRVLSMEQNAAGKFNLGHGCDAHILIGLLRTTLGARPYRSAFTPHAAAQLQADAVNVDIDVLTSHNTAACDGSVRTAGALPAVQVGASTAAGLTLNVLLPLPRVFVRTVHGKVMLDVAQAGLGSLAQPGEPDTPQLARLFAQPPGTRAQVHVLDQEGLTETGVNLYPQQPQAADSGSGSANSDPSFADPAFQIDKTTYASRTPFPGKLARAGSAGLMRDLTVGRLTIAGARFVGRTHSLRLLTHVSVRVGFHASATDVRPTFGPAEAVNPWDQGSEEVYADTLINYAAVRSNVTQIPSTLGFCGEELLVITPPDLATAANTLATARRNDGYLTRVVLTGSGGTDAGTTPAQIQSYIRSQVVSTKCEVHPSFVVLMGNTAELPTFLPVSPWSDTGFDGHIASDLPYALVNGADLLPDLAVGRIPAPDEQTAMTVVNKIIGYEDSPPAAASFYSSATVASYFQAYPDDNNQTGSPQAQDTRTFIRTAETVRNALRAKGKSVDRVYTTETTGSPNPQSFDDGTPLPAALRKPTFQWNGTGTDVVNDWNAGRFLIFHRDHGFPGGWGAPYVDTTFIPSLTNGAQLPVVFSVNCASGKFDDPGTPSFAEQLVEDSAGGAVGAVGDSRNSPSGTNSTMALGMFDAIFPNVLPAYGGTASIRRMGLVLNAGKAYVDAQEGSGSSTAQAEMYLYHWFGDPTMPIWRGQPLRMPSAVIRLVDTKITLTMSTHDTDGLEATLLDQRGRPIGRAIVHHGAATITPETTFTPNPNAKSYVELSGNGFLDAQDLVPAV
jgi:hypothetical protein